MAEVESPKNSCPGGEGHKHSVSCLLEDPAAEAFALGEVSCDYCGSMSKPCDFCRCVVCNEWHCRGCCQKYAREDGRVDFFCCECWEHSPVFKGLDAYKKNEKGNDVTTSLKRLFEEMLVPGSLPLNWEYSSERARKRHRK